MFVILAWKGMSSCIKYGHDRVFLVAFLSYLVIGVGSMLFHSTLICSLKSPLFLLTQTEKVNNL